jgi:hypothetical protein
VIRPGAEIRHFMRLKHTWYALALLPFDNMAFCKTRGYHIIVEEGVRLSCCR